VIPEPKDDLILKYLSGNASAEEERELFKWMEESPENKKTVNDLQKIWALPDQYKIPGFDTEAEWKKFDSILDKEDESKVRRPDFRRNMLLKVAASVAFLFVCSFLLYQTLFSTSTIVKESGDRSVNFTLDDGTAVTLNAHSTFTYTSDFGEKHRAVKLNGEAFFQVARDAEKPFTILADKTEVKVLGTSFNIRAYPDERENEVFVVTGKVSMKLREKEYGIVLSPGMKGILKKDDNTLASTAVEDSNAIAWKSKELIFKGTRLDEVTKSLEDYFNITITVKNPDLLKCRFTSSFRDPTLEEVIDALSIALNLNIIQQNKRIVIDGKGC
jgi:transmembrane sensor